MLNAHRAKIKFGDLTPYLTYESLQRQNPKSLAGDKAESGIGLRSILLSRLAHGKCAEVDSGVDVR
jgi:hypothetical protein